MSNSPNIDFHPAAAVEFDEADNWYFEVNPRVATDFREAIYAVLRRIHQNPLEFPVFARNLRRCVVKGFPYVILFDDSLTPPLIVAVAHTRRKPGYWKDRISS